MELIAGIWRAYSRRDVHVASLCELLLVNVLATENLASAWRQHFTKNKLGQLLERQILTRAGRGQRAARSPCMHMCCDPRAGSSVGVSS